MKQGSSKLSERRGKKPDHRGGIHVQGYGDYSSKRHNFVVGVMVNSLVPETGMIHSEEG